jgi:hypothetical protein
MNKIRDEKGNITTDTNEIRKITQEYFENLYSRKLKNQEETEKFLNTFNTPKLNKEDIKNLKIYNN